MDFDWTDHGTAEDHADRVERVGDALGQDGRYVDATDMHIAAQCIRYLSAKAEMLEKENEAAEAEIDRLTHDIERHVQIAGDLASENEALRDALYKMLNWRKDGCGGEECADGSCVVAYMEGIARQALTAYLPREK